MKPKLTFFLVVMCTISCSLKVQGLECHVCDMKICSWGSWGWETLKEYPKYRVECEQSAIGCASYEASTEDPYAENNKETWFQRTCLYPDDAKCLGLEPQQLLPGEEDLEGGPAYFSDKVACMNSERNGKGIELIKEVPMDSLLRIGTSETKVKVRTCEGNGCNKWKGRFRSRTDITLAEGFPMDVHEQRQKDYETKCFSCSSNDTRGDDPKGCENHYKEFTNKDQGSSVAYGCAMLAIYQIAGGMSQKDFFVRDYWLPGDQWCLERSYNSTPVASERSLRKTEKANIRYYKRSWDGESTCTQDDYSRALKGRELDFDFEWIKDRKFYSAD